MDHKHLLGTDRVGDIQDLKPESSGEVKLTPETKVLCINRGRDVVKDTFDSRHYTIEPGYFTCDYGAALHFKNRAVVPGSRNPETHFQASFIAVIGVVVPTADGFKVVLPVDHHEQWDPFTDDECREYGHAIEALDRDGMLDAIEDQVEIVPTPGTGGPKQSRVKSGGGKAAAKSRKPRIEGPGADKLQPGKVGENVAQRLNDEAEGGD